MSSETDPQPSTKPYLIRAIYEWCTDSGYTPYLAVVVDEHTRVPMEHVKNGEIVLNISALATSKLQMGNDLVEFQARFGGTARIISVPISNVSAIYARENGHGMAFDVVRHQGQGHDAPAATAPSTAETEAGVSATHPASKTERQPLSVVGNEPPQNDKPGGPPKGKTKLTIIK